MRILERIYRCRYCNREMPSEGCHQNPHCVKCLPERLAAASKESGPFHLVDMGNGYAQIVRGHKPTDLA